MYIPKVIVIPMELERNIQIISNFVDPEKCRTNKSLPFAEKTYRLYPELKGLIREHMNMEEVVSIVTPIVTKHFEVNNEKIQARVAYFQEKFNSYSELFIREQLSLYDVIWPQGKDIICSVGYTPFYPRNAVDKSFCVSYADEERVFMGMEHEVNHFIFFEKWKQLYGYEENQEPHHPSPLWFGMEMIVDATLNTPAIQAITNHVHRAYDKFYECKIQGISVMEHLNIFFRDRKSIKDMLDITYRFCVDNIEILHKECG